MSGWCVVVTILTWGYVLHLHKRHEESGDLRIATMLLLSTITVFFGLLELAHAVGVLKSSRAVRYYGEAGCFPEAIVLLLLSLWIVSGVVRRRVFLP